mmetsp:Transcript_63392/g.131878  ORF Transcript_63392/g.131878 Transcript_63392/m.131878 type:complete len:86 (-) Transcript_63392:8-265(-)
MGYARLVFRQAESIHNAHLEQRHGCGYVEGCRQGSLTSQHAMMMLVLHCDGEWSGMSGSGRERALVSSPLPKPLMPVMVMRFPKN